MAPQKVIPQDKLNGTEVVDSPEILDLLKRSINLNELNEESMNYLTS